MTRQRKAKVAGWVAAVCVLCTMATAIPMVSRGMQQPAPHDTWLEVLGVAFAVATLASALLAAKLTPSWRGVARVLPQQATIWRVPSQSPARVQFPAQNVVDAEPVILRRIPRRELS